MLAPAVFAVIARKVQRAAGRGRKMAQRAKQARQVWYEPSTIEIPTNMTKVCPECKKEFAWYGEQWVYRGQKKGVKLWYCSYKCWRAEDHRQEAKGKSLLSGGNYIEA